MRQGTRKRFWAIAAVAALSACGAAAQSGAGEIAAPGADGAERCIYDAKVLDPADRTRMLWGVSLLDGGRCVTRIRVNERPQGYELLRESRPVEQDRTYPVFIRGPGYEVTLSLPL
jgi:hypothetical protein